MTTTYDLTTELAAQHADYEADLEPANYGIDPFDTITPVDLDSSLDGDRPCAYCGHTNCTCIDVDSPYGPSTYRRGW